MEKLLFTLLFIFIFSFTTNSQDLIEIIDSVGSSTSQLVTPISLTGNFNELVISVGFPDVASTYQPPVLVNPSQYPIYGINENEVLLQTLIAINNGSYPVDQWYEPAFDNYFDVHSGGLYNVDFEFLKAGPNSRYLTSHNLSYFISLNNNNDTNVVWNEWQAILNDIAEVIYNDDQHAFDDIDAIHFTFEDLPKHQFHKTYGGTINDNVTLSSGGTDFYVNKPITIQRKAEAIAHENLHLLGEIAQHPDFDGFPDRGRDRSVGNGHRNMFWTYDMMYHNGPLPHTYSLYGLSPLLSHDLIYLGWIRTNEILEINSTNYSNYSTIKLADINYQLNSTQISQGYRRIVKVMIEEDYSPGLDEYFLVEFHNASEFDKAFGNYDEYQTHGYNTGVLIWHIKEKSSGDNYIDLEAAVPYNGWYGNPIPDDNYPRDYDRSNVPGISVWNGNYAGDFDYLDDDYMKNIGTSSNPHWVFYFMPDGGRHVWETTTTPSYSWYPADPTLFIREQSMRSDFFSDETIKGHVTDKITDATRPSTKDWGSSTSASKKTHIAITDIKRESGYMSLQVHYNYWAGEVTENSTMSGDVTVDGNLTVAAGVTLTIEPGTTIEFLDGASLKVSGTLSAVGTSNNRITFTNSSGTWGGIKFYSGSSGNVKYADISEATYGIYINSATPNIQNCNLNDNLYGIYATGSYSTSWSTDAIKSNIIENNTGYGIYLYNSSPTLYGNTVENNNIGVALFTNCNPVIALNNINSNTNYGLSCYSSSSPLVYYNVTYSKGGHNQVRWHGSEAIKITGTSNPSFGKNSNQGYNSFTDGTTTYLIYNTTSNTINAEGNWWGYSTGPLTSQLYGSIDYYPWLTSDPNSSSISYKPNNANQVSTSEELSIAIDAFYKGNYLEAAILFRAYIMDHYEAPDIMGVIQYYYIALTQIEEKSSSVLSSINQLRDIKFNNQTQADISGLYSAILERNGKHDEALAELDQTIINNAAAENINQLKLQKAILLIHSLNQKEKGIMLLKELLTKEKKNSYLYEIASSELTMLSGIFQKGSLIQEAEETLPTDYSLANNYPNPFNPSTTITFTIPQQEKVELIVYDVLGRKVAELVNQTMEAGKYNIDFNASNLSSGTYIYKITAGSFTESKKMLLVK